MVKIRTRPTILGVTMLRGLMNAPQLLSCTIVAWIAGQAGTRASQGGENTGKCRLNKPHPPYHPPCWRSSMSSSTLWRTRKRLSQIRFKPAFRKTEESSSIGSRWWSLRSHTYIGGFVWKTSRLWVLCLSASASAWRISAPSYYRVSIGILKSWSYRIFKGYE